MENIPDYINDTNRSVQLMELVTKLMLNDPLSCANATSNVISVTAQEFNIPIESVRKIVLDQTSLVTDESSKKEKDVLNFYNFLLEKTLLALQ